MDNFSNCKFYRVFGAAISNGEHPNKFYNGTRSPTHMGLEEHRIIDDWFMSEFGIRARSSTIFVGTQIESVKKYICSNSGVIKKISFPEESIYIFSTQIEDLYEHINFLKYRDGYADCRNISDHLNQSNYQKTNNPELVPFSFLGEIMVYCTSFLLEDS